MTKRLTVGALLSILLTGVTVVACSTELGNADAQPAVQTVPQTVPVPLTEPETTTTTTEAPPPVTEAPVTTQAPIPTTVTTVRYVPPPITTVYVAPTTEPPPAVESYVGAGCVIPAYICQRESGFSYTALNPSSGAGGMYQFMPSTWNGIARAIAPEWVGTPPHTAPPYVQDQFATYLWAGGAGCGHWSAC